MTDRMELPNQDKIRMLREKETYNYTEILEAGAIKKVEMKDKIKKEYPGEPESYLRQNYKSETLSNGYIPGLSLRNIFGAILEVDPEKNLNKWIRENKN